MLHFPEVMGGEALWTLLSWLGSEMEDNAQHEPRQVALNNSRISRLHKPPPFSATSCPGSHSYIQKALKLVGKKKSLFHRSYLEPATFVLKKQFHQPHTTQLVNQS